DAVKTSLNALIRTYLVLSEYAFDRSRIQLATYFIKIDLFEPQRRLPMKKSRQQLQREKALLEQSQKLGLQDGSASVPPEQLLSTPTQRVNNQRAHPSPAGPSPLTLTSSAGRGKPPGIESQPQEPGLQNSRDGCRNAEVLTPKPNCKVEKKKMELQEKSRWEVLQQEQRLMEERNKRKKALLAQAIAERSKRTQAETVKLKRIQKELQALDDMVSADIGILRNRIDQASLEYSYARKRFDRAEAEYITAKLDLQRKTETKEQLTEHLCTIIQQNELRKAKKLEELMQQLDVQVDEEAVELELEVEQLLQEQEGERAACTMKVKTQSRSSNKEGVPGIELRSPDSTDSVFIRGDSPGFHYRFCFLVVR
ncbi:hypothetical protein STEG23_037521, partial [Scotinomys teguina]